MIFGGFGPIILGIIYAIIDSTGTDLSLDGKRILVSVVSVYLLAFIHAGASVFNQIENFSLPKSMLCHLSTLYAAYIICYLINSWLPFDPKFLLFFTAVFLLIYFAVWTVVVISIRLTGKKLNRKLNESSKRT